MVLSKQRMREAFYVAVFNVREALSGVSPVIKPAPGRFNTNCLKSLI